ncbi:MAG TPA: phosphoserine phosphatase SerB [Propionibacteriaceae bacterium]|nr:phosphoserine phosphatase SerB [Propionibacteriaceae bacterium]
MPEPSTLAVTITGADRPGVTALLAEAASLGEVELLDFEQTIVRGQLSIGMLVSAPPEQLGALEQRVVSVGEGLGLSVHVVAGEGDNPTRRSRAIVTLLGRPLLAAHLAVAAAMIHELGGNIDRARRLSRTPLTSIELWVSPVDPVLLRRVMAIAAADSGFDASVSPAGIVRHGRRLVVMDVDSTLIQDEVIELLARHAGREDEVRRITERAMRGDLDFSASLTERVRALAGLPASVFAEVLDAVRLTPGARTLVATLKELGLAVGVVSGGFIEVVGPLAAELGIDYAHANRLEVVDGHLTGRVLGDIVDRATKAEKLREWAAAENLPLSRTVAIGDGANDLDMLAAAGLGVAFNAKPTVRASADTSINLPYLDAVLFLMGLSREEVEDATASYRARQQA